MTNRRRQGNEFEKLAANYLQSKGYYIKETNFYCKIGEIDIIAKDGEYLVFVEVKYRTNRQSGNAIEAVNYSKIRKICRTADYYLLTHNYTSDMNIRFDVVAIQEGHLKHYTNAFEYVL